MIKEGGGKGFALKNITEAESGFTAIEKTIKQDPVGKAKVNRRIEKPSTMLSPVKQGSSILDRGLKEAGIMPLHYNPLWAAGAGIGAGLWATQAKRNEGSGVGEAMAYGIPAGFIGHHVAKHVMQTKSNQEAMGKAQQFNDELHQGMGSLEERLKHVPTNEQMGEGFLRSKGSQTLAGGLGNLSEGIKAKAILGAASFTGKNLHEVAQKHYGDEYAAGLQNHADMMKQHESDLLSHKTVHANLESLKGLGVNQESFLSHIINRAGNNTKDMPSILSKPLDEMIQHPLVQSALKEHIRGKSLFGRLQVLPKVIERHHL